MKNTEPIPRSAPWHQQTEARVQEESRERQRNSLGNEIAGCGETGFPMWKAELHPGISSMDLLYRPRSSLTPGSPLFATLKKA